VLGIPLAPFRGCVSPTNVEYVRAGSPRPDRGFGEEHLDGDEAVEAGFAGLVDDRHSAFARLLKDVEVKRTLADQSAPRFRYRRDAAETTLPASDGKKSKHRG
jgi:hypothetical protein